MTGGRTVLLAADTSAVETCRDFSIMSNADTFYVRPQHVEGCAASDDPSTSSRYIARFIILYLW